MKPTSYLWRLAAAATVLLLLVSTASAQGKWWVSEPFKRELGLTADQSRRLEEVFQAALPSLRAQKKALDDAEKQFQDVMQRGNYSSAMEQVDRLESSRFELNRTRTMMLVNMRRLLTTEQWIKLDAMHQAAEQRKADAARRPK